MSDTSSVTSARAGPDAGKVSGRKGNKKVRTGCMTCKIRKVKCDEAKPSCLRCVRTGRKCDGYPVIRPRASRTRSPSPIVGFDTPDQVHAFDYFRQRSSILLGGITNESGEFWDGIVVQLSIVEPAVRHAVLALSSLHESLAITGDSNRGASTDFAFAEYGKAIAAVRNWDTESHASDPTAIPLLVCVLFICIEFLMDYESASQLHICQGRLILAKLQHQQLSSPTMDMIRKFLVPIYARLSLATYLFAVTPEPIPGYLTYEPGYTPTSFTSINEARDVLFHILDEGLRFSTRSKPAVYEPSTEPWQLHMMEMTQQQYLTQLAQWNTAFTVFKTTLETETSASKATQSLLYVYYHAAFIWISTALSPLETAFDDHEAGFTALISHAATAIAEAGSSIKEDGAFTFETEIIAPVYWVVTKCRHPLLRRAALRLLDKEELKRRRENIWRAPELVKISSRVIETEEGTVPSQYNDTLSETYGHFDGYWHFLNDVSIPVTKMPTYQKPQVAFTEDQITADIANEASLKTQRPRHESPIGFEPIAQDSDEAASTPLLDPSCLKSPYGVPESRRIKNAIVGPHKPGGVWLTTFMDPQPGHLNWDSRRVFLRV